MRLGQSIKQVCALSLAFHYLCLSWPRGERAATTPVNPAMRKISDFYTSLEPGELTGRLRRVRHAALDMDGTLYLGSTLFPFTPPFLEGLKRSGVGCSFLTNNPSRSVAGYVEKLAGMGIPARREEIYTSALAAIDWLRRTLPRARRLFVLGTPAMREEFAGAGYVLAADDPADEPDAVVTGFDTTLAYAPACRAAWWIARGKPWVATNPDRVCPTDLPTVLIDCGSITRMLAHATGREPDAVPGKPDPGMLLGVASRYGVRPGEIAMCGDRIYTDMAAARAAGALGVLVLSGEAALDEALAADPAPDLVVPHVGVFGRLLAEAADGTIQGL